MAVHPDLPPKVLAAAIAAAGEIRRHYPHSDRDFATDVSAMLMAAYSEWMRPDFFQAPEAAT